MATTIRLLDVEENGFRVVVNNIDGRYRGWFEHLKEGEDWGGGLWFEKTDAGIELYDFDGTYTLPPHVALTLREHDYIVDEEFE